ncbi:MAG: biotin/lipoyl-binding protein, partial [Myxococcota bacterium]
MTQIVGVLPTIFGTDGGARVVLRRATMSGSFPRTTRSLRADRAAPLALGLAVAGALALGWLGWSALARVPVRAVSRSARIEAAAEPRRIQAAVAGAVSAVEVGLGDPVQAGQLLIRLDDAAARSALADATSTRDALGHQLERLAEAREALSGAGSLDEAARRSAAAAARSKLDQVEVAARQAE